MTKNPLESLRNQPENYARAVLLSDEPLATTVLAAAIRLIGREAILGTEEEDPWDPLAIWAELKDQVGLDLNPIATHRLFAIMTALTTDRFYTDVGAFINICNAISGDPVTDAFDPADPWEMAWAVTEIVLLDSQPGVNGDEPIHFNEDIRRYMGITLEEAGIAMLPTSLKMAISSELRGWSDVLDDTGLSAELFNVQNERAQDVNLYVQELLQRLDYELAPFKDKNSGQKSVLIPAEEKPKYLGGRFTEQILKSTS